MNLREDKHWSYGAFTFSVDARGQRPFMAYAPVQTDKTAEALQELRAELKAITGQRPPTAAELARVQTAEVLSLPGRWESADAVAGALAESVRYGLADDYWQHYAEGVRAVALPDVDRAARTWIRPGQQIFVVVGDRAVIEPGLRNSALPRSAPLTPMARPCRVFYGWYVAASAILIYFFTNGLGVFVPQNLAPRLMESFDASAAEIGIAYSITFGVTACIAPFAGALVDRVGVVRVMRAGLRCLPRRWRPIPSAARSSSSTHCTPGWASGSRYAACWSTSCCCSLVRAAPRARGRRPRLRLEPCRRGTSTRHLALGYGPCVRLALGVRRARRRILRTGAAAGIPAAA